MARLIDKFTKYRDDLIKYTLVLVTIFLISLLFPNSVRFKYEYQVGQVWKYEDLVAPFDFAVLKPKAEFDAEVAEMKTQQGSYFLKSPDVARRSKEEFVEDFNRIKQTLDPNEYRDVFRRQIYVEEGIEIMDKYYEEGILYDDSMARSEEFPIHIVQDKVVSEASPLFLNDVFEAVRTDLQESSLQHSSLLYPVLERHLEPNIRYSDSLTQKFAQAAVTSIPRTRGKVTQGDLIVPANGLVTEEVALRLDSFREAYESQISERKSDWVVLGGYLILTSLIVGVYLYYLQFHNRKVFKSWRKLLFMLMWLLLFGYLVYIVEGNGTLSTYMIPFCIAPIVIKTFYNDRLALFSLIVIVLIASFLSSLGYEFTFLQILAGMVTVLTNHITRYWSKFFNSILLILLTYCLGYLGLSLIKEGSIATIEWSMFIWFFINVVLTLLAYPLVPLLERVFGFTSSITLSELTDVNKPLLRELSIKAPGTFQHSLQVGNLAEAAADTIGADALLLRVAALYHDIGKIKEPNIFIENQGTNNPHDQLTPEESASKIIAHVTDGVALAKKNRLPHVIIDFIRTHHGTTRVEYFYQSFIKTNGEPAMDHESVFRYPGPKPSTREQAILMLADSVEAAARSLKDPGENDINNLVDKIIALKIDYKQLQYADLSFRELEKIRVSLKKVLKSIYHIRVEYPDANPTTTVSAE